MVAALRTPPSPAQREQGPELSVVRAAWPQNVPNRRDAVALLYNGARLPPELHQVTARLMSELTQQQLAEAPPGIELERWVLSLATVWRLRAAATLASQARRTNEEALQDLLTEAAETRDWLDELELDALTESPDQACALRAVLQVAWDAVLKRAPHR